MKLPSAGPAQAQNRARKDAEFFSGTDRLLARRKRAGSGQYETFTQSEIAHECGLHPRVIVEVERRALYKMAHRLKEAMPTFFNELLGDKEMKEIFGRLKPDVMKTGKPRVRPRKLRHFAPVASTRGAMDMREVARLVRANDQEAFPTPQQKRAAWRAKQARQLSAAAR